MPPDDTLLPEATEFETKYRVEDHLLIKFKQLIETLPGEKSFIYVEGPDHYYLHPEWFFKSNPDYDPAGTFVRYRRPSYGLDNDRCEVTWKYKLKTARTNISRVEHNWRVDGTPEANIRLALADSGVIFNFSIIKTCHIYKLEDVTIVFYTVYDTTDGEPSKAESFLEIEVCEEKTKGLTEAQAMAIISEYEKKLEPLGINAQKRLRQSLFTMYRR